MVGALGVAPSVAVGPESWHIAVPFPNRKAQVPSAHAQCPAVLTCVLVSGESSSGISRDDYIGQVAKDVENKTPQTFDLDQVRKHLGMGMSPTSVVLLQELERFNKLVVRMSRSLAELQRVSWPDRCAVAASTCCLGSLTTSILSAGLGWRSWNEQRVR